jgi:hypothetical protein
MELEAFVYIRNHKSIRENTFRASPGSISTKTQYDCCLYYARKYNIKVVGVFVEEDVGKYGVYGMQPELVKLLRCIQKRAVPTYLLSYSPNTLTQDTLMLLHAYEMITPERLLFVQRNIINTDSVMKRVIKYSLCILSEQHISHPECVGVGCDVCRDRLEVGKASTICRSCSNAFHLECGFFSNEFSVCGLCVANIFSLVVENKLDVQVTEENWHVVEAEAKEYVPAETVERIETLFSPYRLDREETKELDTFHYREVPTEEKVEKVVFKKPVHSMVLRKRIYRK